MQFNWAMLALFAVCGIVFIVLGVRRYQHAKARGPIDIEAAATLREKDALTQAAQATRIRWIALIVVGVWFLVLAIAVLANSTAALVLLVVIPLGIGMFAFGVYFAIAPAFYRVRVDDAKYVEAQNDPQPREKDKVSRLVFSYTVDGEKYVTASQDDMIPGRADEFKAGLPYTIWVNAGKPSYFRVRRWKYFPSGVLSIIVGAAVVVGPIIGILSV